MYKRQLSPWQRPFFLCKPSLPISLHSWVCHSFTRGVQWMQGLIAHTHLGRGISRADVLHSGGGRGGGTRKTKVPGAVLLGRYSPRVLRRIARRFGLLHSLDVVEKLSWGGGVFSWFLYGHAFERLDLLWGFVYKPKPLSDTRYLVSRITLSQSIEIVSIEYFEVLKCDLRNYVGMENRLFAIYQIMLVGKTCKYHYETVELPNPRPAQNPRKSG